jgi:hypothetical protein
VLLLAAAVHAADFPPPPQAEPVTTLPVIPAPRPVPGPQPAPQPFPVSEPLPPATPGSIPLAGMPADEVPLEGHGSLLPEAAPPPPTPCRFYGNLEFLLWQVKQGPVPPLLTTGSANAPIPGALGMPGTIVLVGGNLGDAQRSGGRFTAGYWLNDAETWGLEGTFLLLRERGVQLQASSSGGVLLARPFLDVNTGTEDADIIALRGAQSGSALITASSEVWGAEASVRAALLSEPGPHVDLVGGFRTLSLREHLGIADETTVEELSASHGNRTLLEDNFAVRNQFYGAQLGALAEFARGRWSLDLRGKFALGLTEEEAQVNGVRRVTFAASHRRRVFLGGLLAQPTNSGDFSGSDFAILPELGLDLGFQITNNVRAFVGYTLLYWSSVARPGDVIDRGVNPTLFPPGAFTGPHRPAFTFQNTDFWMQGVDFGLQIRF